MGEISEHTLEKHKYTFTLYNIPHQSVSAYV